MSSLVKVDNKVVDDLLGFFSTQMTQEVLQQVNEKKEQTAMTLQEKERKEELRKDKFWQRHRLLKKFCEENQYLVLHKICQVEHVYVCINKDGPRLTLMIRKIFSNEKNIAEAEMKMKELWPEFANDLLMQPYSVAYAC